MKKYSASTFPHQVLYILSQGREILETEVHVNIIRNVFLVIFVFTTLDRPGSVFDVSSDFQFKEHYDMFCAARFPQLLHS